jgi:hypothetical protein
LNPCLPQAPIFSPILFGQTSTCTYINCKGQMESWGEGHGSQREANGLLIWGARGQRGASFGDFPQLQKNKWWGTNQCAPSLSLSLSLSLTHTHTHTHKTKIKRKCGCTHELINLRHIILTSNLTTQMTTLKNKIWPHGFHAVNQTKRLWYMESYGGEDPQHPHFIGHGEPAPHQCTIHWIPYITQLWMNLNWVNIWFHLGNQFCMK